MSWSNISNILPHQDDVWYLRSVPVECRVGLFGFDLHSTKLVNSIKAAQSSLSLSWSWSSTSWSWSSTSISSSWTEFSKSERHTWEQHQQQLCECFLVHIISYLNLLKQLKLKKEMVSNVWSFSWVGRALNWRNSESPNGILESIMKIDKIQHRGRKTKLTSYLSYLTSSDISYLVILV